MSFVQLLKDRFRRGPAALFRLIAVVPAYLLYVGGISTNPPGFYVDEATVGYNAYHFYLTGQSEFGHSWPLYFPVFNLGPPDAFLGYLDPVQIYIHAALHYIFPPSVMLSRGISATAMFLAAFALGYLAKRISGHMAIAAIVTISALLTPWLFGIGRLAFGGSLFPLMLALLLIAVHRAYGKMSWSLSDLLFIAASLALITYTYAIGRLLGPLFALGLLLFAADRKLLMGVFKTWVAYAVMLIPIFVFHVRYPTALTGRFMTTVGYIKPDKSYLQIFVEFLQHYAANISPIRILITGDPNLRHHVPGTSPVLVAVFLLAIAGIVFILVRYRRDRWWLFVLFGLVISVIPASLTVEEFHMLRLSGLPVFLIVLTIPALMWLFDVSPLKAGIDRVHRRHHLPRGVRAGLLAGVLLLLIAQSALFHVGFLSSGPSRAAWFDAGISKVFAAAVEQPGRPIYLLDHVYYLTYWNAIVRGVSLDNFVSLPVSTRPQAGSLVMSIEGTCANCTMLAKEDGFVFYQIKPPPEPDRRPPTRSDMGLQARSFFTPRGLAVDGSGRYYVADTYNSRIQVFQADQKLILTFGTEGIGPGQLREPHGVAVDQEGNIYVTDAANQKLLKYRSDGTFLKEWSGPDTGFDGPRDIEFGPNGLLYIVDQARTRVLKFDPVSETFTGWGRPGGGLGEFNAPAGITVSGDLVYVTDTGNGRIKIFDLGGNYVRQWPVEQWARDIRYFPDVAVDEELRRVFVSSGLTNEVLVYDMDGKLVDRMKPSAPNELADPSSIALVKLPKGKRLYVLSTGTGGVDSSGSGVSVFDVEKGLK